MEQNQETLLKYTNLIHEYLVSKIDNKTVLEKIKKHMYIAGIGPHDISVVVDDTFVRNIIINQYYSVLEEAITEKLQSNYEIKFYNSVDDVKKIVNNAKAKTDDLEKTGSFRIDDTIRSNIERHLTFKNYIVSESNRFATTVTKGAVEQLGKAWNPIFLYGNSGYGKTHLINAFGNLVLEQDSNKLVKVYDGNSFKSELYAAFSKGSAETNAFKEKVMLYDVLIVDDVQFIGTTNESVKEVFFEIFNKFIQLDKQVVFSSDVSPNELKDMKLFHDRVITRFSQGVTAALEKPDQELKEKIVESFWDNVIARTDDETTLSRDAIIFIASNCDDIRSIQGTINGIYISLVNRPTTDKKVTKDYIANTLPEILGIKKSKKNITMTFIAKMVSHEFGIEVKSIQGTSRVGIVAEARKTFIFLARELLNSSYKELGDFLKRKHPTIISGFNSANSAKMEKPQYRELLEKLATTIKKQ